MILDQVYNDIEALLTDRLRTNFSQAGFKALGTIDIFNDQFTELAMGNEIAMTFPAILIEFSDIDYTQQGRNVQQGEAVVRIHIGQNLLDYADKKGKALGYLDFVHRALQGSTGTLHNGLMRERMELDISAGNLIVHVMEYTTRIYDNSADKQVNLEEVQATLEVQFQNSLP